MREIVYRLFNSIFVIIGFLAFLVFAIGDGFAKEYAIWVKLASPFIGWLVWAIPAGFLQYIIYGPEELNDDD